MPSNYDQIRQDNIREYGEGIRHLAFLGRLYADRTHFIFELLQNAEDACERDKKRDIGKKYFINFHLLPDQLLVRHNGILFDEKDVRGICGVAEGTKESDLTQIGEFGIGFKSVYAYTKAPEIYSGQESFRIENYVRPYATVLENFEKREEDTLFVFPFNHENITASTAFGEIAKRLRELGSRPLLFLNNIEEINWTIHGEGSGNYIRENKVVGEHSRRAYILSKVGNHKDTEEEWLIFDRLIEWDNTITPNLKVEVAFKINKKGKKETVIPADDSCLVVFFPTEKETHLKFLIQGPYRTTPARDNIPKDDKWNIELIKETAILVANSIERVKEMDLLNVDFLNILPISEGDFPKDHMFRPIYDEVLNKLKSNVELLPANDNTYISSKQTFLARGKDLIDLFDSKQLSLLFGKEDPKWLDSKITQDRTPKLREYLTYKLSIEEITPEKFAHNFNKEFIEQQSDDWIIKFYSFLLDHNSLWEYNWHPLRKKPFIRLEDDTHVAPFDNGDPQAYLPTDENSHFPTVKKKIIENEQARKFLEKLNLTEPDRVAEVLQFILPKYKRDQLEIAVDENIKDVKKILVVLKVSPSEKKPDLISKLKSSPFLIGRNYSTGERSLFKPEEIYLTEIYAGRKDIEIYFDGNPDVIFLDKVYEDLKKGEKELLLELGCSDKVRVKCKEPNWARNVILHDYRGFHARGLDGFDPNCEMDGLEHALRNITSEKANIVWETLKQYSQCIHGIVESSSRQDYSWSETKEQSSTMGKLVRSKNWLPDKKGNFHKPFELSLADLPDDFDKQSPAAKALAEKLGFREDVEKQLEISLPPELRERWKIFRSLDNEDLQAFEQFLSERKTKPLFPEHQAPDKARREEKAQESYLSSEEKKSEKRERTVRISRDQTDIKAPLRQWYQDEDEKVICQICKRPSSFKNQQGQYYFEAIEMVIDEKEYYANALALCPLCAAKYLYGERTDDEEIKQKLIELYGDFKNGISNQRNLKITISLCDETINIHFVEKHLIDLSPIFITSQNNE